MKRIVWLASLLVGAAGCFGGRTEVFEANGSGGSLGSAAANSSSGAGSATATATGVGSGPGIGATGTNGSTTGGNSLGMFCNSLVSTFSTLSSEVSKCGYNFPLQLTSAECLLEAGNCSAADLAALNSALQCANALPTGQCLDLLIGLDGCEGTINKVSCLNFGGSTAGIGGSTGGFTGGLGTGGFGSFGGSTGGFGSFGGSTGGFTGGFGTGGFGASVASSNSGTGSFGGFGATGFGSGGFLDAGFPGTGGFGTGGQAPPTPYCGACTRSRQCGTPNACITDAEGNSVCGQDCSMGQTCPAGSTCESTSDVRGHMVQQCVPMGCGDAG